MKRQDLPLFALGVATAAACAPPARAVPAVEANLGAATDYVFRGVSQTDGRGQVFAGADLTSGSLYLGTWASNVDFGDGTDAEIDVYGGWRPQVAGWTLDLGAVAYLYPGQPAGADDDYVEAKLAASRTFGRTGVGLSAYWSPDYFGAAEDEAAYVQGDLSYQPAERWTVSAALGRQTVSSDLDYSTWNLGVTWAATGRASLDLRYSDTDRRDLGDAYQARVVATVKAVF